MEHLLLKGNVLEELIINTNIPFNPRIKLELKKEDYNDMNVNSDHTEYKDIYNVTCISTFINQLDNNREMKFKDENILVKGIDGKYQGFTFLINELTNEDYEGEVFKY